MSALVFAAARASDGLVGFAFGFFLLFALPAVVKLFTFGHGNFAFGDAIPEIDLGWDDGHAFLLGLDQKPINLSTVQQQFAFPQRFVISKAARQVFRDMAIDEPGFAAANLRERLAQSTFSLAERLYFSADEHDSGFEAVEQLVVVRGRAILRNNLDAGVLILIGARFGHKTIIAAATDKPQVSQWERFPVDARKLNQIVIGLLEALLFLCTSNIPLFTFWGIPCRLVERMLDLFGTRQNLSGGLLLRRLQCVALLAMVAVALEGCPKGNSEVAEGRKAEAIQDYDTALVHFERALRADPTNAEYKLRAQQARFDAGQFHVRQGQKAVKAGDLQLGLAEFQKAQLIDPSNVAADQEVKRTMELILANGAANQRSENLAPPDEQVLSGPPELKPLSRDPINLKMTNDARVVYETIAKLAGLSVIFDPDFTSRRITAELPNVTLEQALDAVSLESKAFWKPITPSVIFVAPDQPQKRKDVEDEEVKTFYLANTLTPQDLTEIVNGLRQLLDLHRVQQVNAQNAIVIRDTPDKLALASKIIGDIDRAKPEVLIHVQVLTASVNRLRDLGVLPGQSISVAFSPRSAFQPNTTSTTSTTSTTTTTTTTSTTSTTSTTANSISLNFLKQIGWQDFAITLPGAQANAILTDDRTRIVQDPELRVTDGQKATLKIGQRVPVATGSFQAGVGVGVTGSSGVVNPLVNTQFQYIDVGVNIEVTPRVHPDGEVSMKLTVEVSSIIGNSNIGGIMQPVISQRKIEHDIRLKEGEVSVLGGLIERTDSKNINGIPGIGEVPLMRYFFSDNQTTVAEDETLIVLTPHILRLPSLTAQNLKPMAAGTDSNVRVYREDASVDTPATAAPVAAVAPRPNPAAANPLPAISPTSMPQTAGVAVMPTPADTGSTAVQLHFEPAVTSMKNGDTATLGLAISNVTDLYSIPLMIHYDPAVIRVEEVRNGGFLSGGTQEIAVVQRIDQQKGEVIVSATRQPNTPGVNGTGTVLGFVVHAIGPGTSHLQILQVNAHNSQQQQIPIVSGEATIQVK